MRLNLRLMGVLHGILVIALIGYFILRISFRGSSRSRNGGAAALPLVGLVLVVLGYVGVFFGRMIKSAVSRQREYLADASAVQFTRNPDGIGGALKKIGGLAEGSVIMNAEQASHFFFSDGKYGKVRAALSGLSGMSHFAFLSTHPPIKDRIRRIDRGWNGRFLDVDKSSRIQPESVTQKAAKAAKLTGEEKMAKLFKLLPLHLTALIGTLDQDHLTYAHKLLAGIPEEVHKAVHEPSAARAVVLALLADGDAEIRARQIQVVQATKDAALLEETQAMVSLLANAPRETRLPLVDLAVPALRRLSPAQYGEFMNLTDVFIKADQQIDLFEYTLMHVLSRHLEPTFKRVEAAHRRVLRVRRCSHRVLGTPFGDCACGPHGRERGHGSVRNRSQGAPRHHPRVRPASQSRTRGRQSGSREARQSLTEAQEGVGARVHRERRAQRQSDRRRR